MFELFRHAKNFVGDISRPIFQGIYFDGENAVVTNSHIMVIVQDVPFPKRLVHWKTGREISGAFPDYKKIIPDKTEFNISYSNIGEVIKALKISMSLSDKKSCDYGPACLLEGLLLSSKNQNMIFTAQLSGKLLDGPNPEISFNGKYLYDILNFFKDSGVEKFQIGFNSRLSPFKITTENNLMAIITPIRVN